MIPPFSSPINAMNKPMPPAIAYFRFMLIAFAIILRIFIKEITKKINPEQKITASPSRHTCGSFKGSFNCFAQMGSRVSTKSTFAPIPGASATGYFATSPIKNDPSAEARQTEVKRAIWSIPVGCSKSAPDSITGCRKMI